MKLSQAILKGCEQVPEQGFGQYFKPSFTEITKACVLGTAVIGLLGFPNENDKFTKLNQILDLNFKSLNQLAVCPFQKNGQHCNEFKYKLRSTALTNILVHLNDDHRMSREDIAAWLDKQDL